MNRQIDKNIKGYLYYLFNNANNIFFLDPPSSWLVGPECYQCNNEMPTSMKEFLKEDEFQQQFSSLGN